jgi:hypothetical protein
VADCLFTDLACEYGALFRPTAAAGLAKEGTSWIRLRGSARSAIAASRSYGKTANAHCAEHGGR